MIHSKRTTLLLLTLLLTFGFVTVAHAWSGTIPGTSISGSTYNEVYVNSSRTQFSSATESWASQAISSIGWTIRTNQQLCGGTVVYGYSLAPVAKTNSSLAYVGPAASTSDLRSCPYGGARSVQVVTRHEFKVSGVSPFYANDGSTPLPAP